MKTAPFQNQRPSSSDNVHERSMEKAISTPDRLLRAIPLYRRLGFGLTPLEGKRPFRNGWQEHRLGWEELEENVRRGRGLGCVHVQSGTATVDLDRPLEDVARPLAAVGVEVEALLEAEGPKTLGHPDNPPKLWYRVPDRYTLGRRALRWPDPEDPTQRVVVLELRAGPVQDVLPPSVHPDTGEPYRWTPDVPRRREDFPSIPAPLLGLWLAWDLLLPRMEASCPWAEGPAEKRGESPARPRGEYRGPGIIQFWNAQVPPGRVLERNGYRKAGERRWVAPSSKTGTPGVFLCDSGRIYSYHESDALASPHSHDSFGLLTILEHGGNVKEAIRAANRELYAAFSKETAP